MAKFPIYSVAEVISCPDPAVKLRNRFFILETYLTLDGPRTRICAGRWDTQEQAEAALKEKMDGRQTKPD